VPNIKCLLLFSSFYLPNAFFSTCLGQGSRIRSVRILFSERYVRTLTYSILAYVNKNRIRKQNAEAANCFFATILINLLFDCVVQNGQFNYKFRDAIIFHRVMDLYMQLRF